MGHDQNHEGADVFWPGYVDAVTNLVLNLLFLLTIMTVAVFMFAMELGRQHVSTNAPRTTTAANERSKQPAEESVESLRQQVESLKKEVQQARGMESKPQKTMPASLAVPKPEKSVDRTQQESGGLVVRFVDDAVALTSAESEKLRGNLQPVLSAGSAKITVVVPSGFSEARRLGFYRAMAVRNLLIELKMPSERIDVSVREGKSSDDASLVWVSPR